MLNTQNFSIGTAAVRILDSSIEAREVILHNAQKSSNNEIWIGASSAVSTETGIHIDTSETLQFVLQPGNQIWAIVNSGTRTLQALWQDV